MEISFETASPDVIEDIADRIAEKCELQEQLKASSQSEIQQTIEDLDFQPYLKLPIAQLSSGWRYKCRLTVAFISRPDLLIIDEPSFLDTNSTCWLVDDILSSKQSNVMVLCISHKEDLLETLCDRILYINSGNLTLTSYNTGYVNFRLISANESSQADLLCSEHQDSLDSAEKSLRHIQEQLDRRERNMKKATTENRRDLRFVKGKNKAAKQKAGKSAAAKVKQLQQQA